ncbi:bifunctional molybdenum cofactor biosynthesis protein MoaC/MoaB [Parafrigoribacterium soli]|uniref:bifunctional molybdenum cofactor biosynthesis protein MoaC/MoaB n=1 Tax=Parafrigoribacterium soli TaxID=3144663 RepID=UPI0032EEAF89
MNELSHVDSDGRARMVDVGDKAESSRFATAGGRITTTAEVVALVRADGMPKADVLSTARIAGINGAKKTSELIPLCHQLNLNSVKVSFELAENSIAIEATAKTFGRTGVEMEALTAVAVAGLTLHDMIKAVDPAAVLGDIRLVSKTGGKRGHWTRDGVIPPAAVRPGTATVVVASTTGASGERPDTTGPVIASWLVSAGYAVDEVSVVPDAGIAAELARVVATAPAVIITTGGTGVSPTDQTPEATAALLDRELPGVAEALRAKGMASTPMAALSRGLVGVAGQTIVVNLPGSRGGVKDGLAVLDELLPHLVAQASGDPRH